MDMPLRSQCVDAALIARACVDLRRIDRTLKRSNFQELAASLKELPIRDQASVRPRDIRRARRYARRIANAAHVSMPRAKCLHRSLTLHSWLRREGFPSELRIGVIKDGAELKAHAWVELADQVVNDRPDAVAVFTPLTRSVPRGDLSLAGRELGRVQWQ